MKKILLVVMMLGVFIGSAWGQSIVGPTKVTVNKEYTYEIVYGKPLTVPVSGGIKVTGGRCNTSNFAIPPGLDIYRFKVTFTEITDKATITVSTNTGNTSITVKVSKGETTSSDLIISGPESLYVNEKGIYRLENYKDKTFRPEWRNPSKGLSIRELPALLVNDPYEVEVTALSSNYENGATSLTCVVPTDGSNRTSLYGYKEIRVICPVIVEEKTELCANENIGYKLVNYRPGATIRWEAGSNLSLVSGQGTSNAIFKGTGNGYGTVKAIITYEGSNYTVESSVWVNNAQPHIPAHKLRFTNIANNKAYWCSSHSGNSFVFVDDGVRTDKFDYYDVKVYTLVNGMPKQEIFSRTYVQPGEIMPSYSPTEWHLFKIRGINKYGVSDWYETEVRLCDCRIYDEINGITGCDCNNNGGGGGSGDETGDNEGILLFNASASDPSSPVSVQIYSFTTGKVVYKDKKAYNFDLQTTNLKEGVYIVVTTDQNGNTKSEKIMKRSR